jgi:NAD(P)H-dependent FMN reductase
MYGPKILVVAASLRAGSHNGRLAALVAKELALGEARITRISVADYPLPLLDADVHRRLRSARQCGQAQAHPCRA